MSDGVNIDDLLNFVGIAKPEDGEITMDYIKENFAKTFVHRDKVIEDDKLVNQIFGRKIGSVDTKIRSLAKEQGVEFTEDHKDMKIEELIGHAFGGVKSVYENKIQELQAGAGGDSEAVKAWEDKYKAIETKYSDTQRLLDEAVQKHTAFVDQTNQEKKQFKLNTVIGGAMESVKFKNDISEVEKAGFKALLNDRYKFDLDEEGRAFAMSTETGQKISNPDKMGEFLTIEQVIQKEAAGAKLVALNATAATDKKLGSSQKTAEQIRAEEQRLGNETKISHVRVLSNAAQGAVK